MTATREPWTEIRIAVPHWIADVIDFERGYDDDDARMRVAVTLARENVVRGTGGPFGAAIFESGTGRLVATGVNLVVPLGNAILHAEIVAFMTAQKRLGSYTLAAEGMPVHELHTSCEPCAMCLGATLWSGVRRVVSAATREDAHRIHFDEGPVFAASYEYLRARGIAFRREVLRDEGRAVLRMYREGSDGVIYNA